MLRNVVNILKIASKMNCLSTLFFLVFLALLTIDGQARVLPEISVKNDLIIVNIAGTTSSLLPDPSTIISSPEPIEEIRRRLFFQIMFDIIGWVTSNPLPKAPSPAKLQAEIASPDDEIASPCNKLIPSTSSLIFLPPGAQPAVPKFGKRSPPPPAPPSSIAPSRIGRISPCLTGTTPWPCSRLKSMEIINHYETPSSLLVSYPKGATPAIPKYERAAHPPPIRQSSKNEQLEDQMINGISSPSDSVISMITDRKNDPQVS